MVGMRFGQNVYRVCKKKLPEQLGFHRYAVSAYPDQFVLSPPLKKFPDPPMNSPGPGK